MPYVAPYIDDTGMHIPTYNDILEDLMDISRSIYGSDIYLGNDSQDYQFLSAIAAKINDCNQTALFVYGNRGPQTAVGSGLDSIVKLNGISRSPATFSTVSVVLSGTAGTIISNGVVSDGSTLWNLPPSVSIDISGQATVTATCQTSGPIVAAQNTITTIETPTLGWDSVNNPTAAVTGTSLETNAQLRAKQAVSTALPSLTVLEGTKGAIANVIGVTRSRVYENDTSVTDANGIPSHSIAAIVEGGSDSDIANAIFIKKGPGSGTYGSTTVNITDSYGVVTPIKFYRPSYVDIDVTITVKAIQGYTSETTAKIKQNVTDFLNTPRIGDDLPVSSIWGPVLQANDSLQAPNFGITSIVAGKHLQAQSTNDIVTLFNEVIRGNISYIVVNVT